MRKITAFLVAIFVMFTTSAIAESTLLEKMFNPDVGAKPMARLWLPDAGAGYVEKDGTNYLWMAEQYVQEMYNAGMGGVELTIVSDGSDLFYENGALYGWGTDAHVRLLKAFVAAANELPEGFIIDITIAPHWPVVINSIDPNDVEQQQELRSVFQKLTQDSVGQAVRDGTLTLEMPQQRTLTFNNNPQLQSPFFYVERLQGAVIAKVSEVDENGQPIEVEFSSLSNLHGKQGKAIGAAGVPGEIVDDMTGENVELKDGMVVEVLEGWKRYTIRKDLYAFNRADCVDTTYGRSNMGTIYYVNKDGELGDVAYERVAWNANIGEYGNTIMPIYNMDLWGDSERMNDTQYSYHVDATDIVSYMDAHGIDIQSLNNEKAILPGDYVLINCYSQGTGQLQSGGSGILMNPQYFAVDFFNKDGAQKAIDYWNEHMLHWMETEKIADGYQYKGMDSTLADLLTINSQRTNGASCIFEDSIECHLSYSAWCIDGVEEYQQRFGEDLTTYLPLICGLSAQSDENGRAERIRENYQLLLGDLYDMEHAQTISDWTHTFGYSYRAQPYSLTGLDVTASSIAVDIPEGDNSTVGDGLRTMRASVNMSDKRYLSMESLTFGYESFLEWTPIMKQINSDYCDGVNRVIFHGSPFNRAYDASFNNYNSQYPGWSWGFMAWNSRQLWWNYAHGITDYIASVQSLLQNGTCKVEVAILRDKSDSFRFTSGDDYNRLMDNGYSYNIMSEQAFIHGQTAKKAVATNGMIYEEGPAYKAIILDNNSYISASMVDKLIQFSQAGVPILFVGNVPTMVYGTESFEGENSYIAAKMTELLQQNNVAKIERLTVEVEPQKGMMMGPMMGPQIEITDETQNQMIEFLKAQHVSPYAEYESDGLQVMVIYDKADSTYYYYFFNNSEDTVSAEVNIYGEGTTYTIDPFSRTVNQMDNCTQTHKRTAFNINLKTSDVKIVAVSSNYDVFPTPRKTEVYTLTKNETITYPDDWNLTIEDHTPQYTKEEVAANTQINPSLTTTVSQNIGVVSLGTWDKLQLSQEVMDKFGKANAGRLAGIGFYQKTIHLNDIGDCAVLAFEKLDATNILKVIVNGTEYNHINAVSLELSTDKLIDGENTIEIIVGTGGANIGENAPASFMGITGKSEPSTEFGLTGFSITTYNRK